MMWEPKTLWQLMTLCVILHNMIVEDEGEGAAARTHDFQKPGVQDRFPEQVAEHVFNFLEMHQQLRDQYMDMQVLNDLLEHMWIHIRNQ